MDNLHNSINDGFNFQSYSSESHSYYPNFTFKSEHNWVNFPFEIPETDTESPGKPLKASSPHLISFKNSLKPKSELEYHENMILIPPFISHQNSFQTQKYYQGLQKFGHSVKRPFGAASRSPLHAQDHVIAERKRREKLTQRFIALSAVLPGLRKVLIPVPNLCLSKLLIYIVSLLLLLMQLF